MSADHRAPAKGRNDRIRKMIRVETRRLIQTGLLTPRAARRSVVRTARSMRLTTPRSGR